MKAEEKVYKAFYDLKEPKLYYNQIKEHTNLSHSSLQNALEKIKNGTFGNCEICNTPIEVDRLMVNAAARTCKTHLDDERDLAN